MGSYVCDKVVVGGGGRTEEEEEARDTESKTRTPHKVVGKKWVGPSQIRFPGLEMSQTFSNMVCVCMPKMIWTYFGCFLVPEW